MTRGPLAWLYDQTWLVLQWLPKRRGRPAKPPEPPPPSSPFTGTFGFSPDGMTHDPAPVPRHDQGQPQDVGTDHLIMQVLADRPNFRAYKAELVRAVQDEQKARGLPVDTYKALYNRVERLLKSQG